MAQPTVPLGPPTGGLLFARAQVPAVEGVGA